MNNLVTVLTVFVSSPSDVSSERLALLRAIERVNRMSFIRDQFVIRPFRFEETPPLAGREAQVVVDDACSIRDCYLVICVFWQRMGTPFLHPETNRHYLSGTEYEFLTAYNAYLSKGQPYVLVYRKTPPPFPAPEGPNTEQAELVNDFFANFEGTDRKFKGLYVSFTTTEDFEERVLHDILNQLHDHPPSRRPEAELPSLVEEDRRLDVALPQEARPQDTIELWVKICTRESPGLSVELPQEPGAPGVPSVVDARNQFMSIAFERKADDGGLLPLPTSVEVHSLDFAILDSTRAIELKSGVDSTTLVFPLRVITSAPRAYVQVRIKTKSLHGDYWIENCSMSCQVHVRSAPLLSRVRALFSASSKTSRNQVQEQELVDELGERYAMIMDGIKEGIKSESELKGVTSRLSEISEDIASVRRKLSTEGARKNLDQLEEVVQKNHDQAESLLMRSELRPKETKIVEEHLSTFKTIMDRLNSKFTSREMLETFRSFVDNARTAALDAESKVTSREAKKLLSTIADRYREILEQIDRVL